MSEITPFLVLAAERTGSNLLAGLLDSHPDIIAGGELFNPVVRKSGDIPWWLAPKREKDELAALRESSPVQFLDRLVAQAVEGGNRFVGFKLMYFHADRCEQVREHLVADENIRVLHLTRWNLLRRYLSLLRARATGEWQQPAKRGGRREQPKVEVSIPDLLVDIARIRRWESAYRQAFAGHPVLELTYENLSQEPVTEGRRALEFLGADPEVDLRVRTRKTGVDPLQDAIVNYDEVCAALRGFAEYVDS